MIKTELHKNSLPQQKNSDKKQVVEGVEQNRNEIE